MDKYSAIKEALEIVSPNYATILKKYADNAIKYGNKTTAFTAEQFVALISQHDYSIKTLGFSASTTSKLLKELFPNRITGSTGSKVCSYILHNVGCKYCARCREVLFLEGFRPNKSQKDCVNTYCRGCQSETTKSTQPGRQAEYRAAKLQRTVPWSELSSIKNFIGKCPAGCHVDHIIPLQGVLVSGLHVLSNLQYLSAADNCSKSNKYLML